MDIPVLMPYQMSPMNGDDFITKEIVALKERFNLKIAIETGTCFGSTSLWMAKHFPMVLTVENNRQYRDIAMERANNDAIRNIYFYFGDSQNILYSVLKDNGVGNDSLFLLDAHWGNECPLLLELTAIRERGIKPCIIIHDMKNPDDDRFGFDKYNDQEFTFEWVKPSLDLIYGEDNYVHYFNTGFKKESAQRGVLFCTPK